MGREGFSFIPLAIVAASFFAAVGFTPRSTEVVETDLRVHTWWKTFHFDLKEAKSAEEISPDRLSWPNATRIFGVGRPLKPYGWFWIRERGIVLAMVSDRSEMVLLDFGRRRVLVSPENSRSLLLALQDRLR